MVTFNGRKDYTIFRMIKCFFQIMRFLIFPPRLATLYNIGSDQSNFRYWALINRALNSSYGKMLRPLWKLFPRIIVYRLFVVPFFLLYMVKLSLLALDKFGKDLNRSIGISLIHQLFWILEVVFENLGIMPGLFFIYKLYLPQNSIYAQGSAHQSHIMFLGELVSFAQHRNASGRLPDLPGNKVKFSDFLRKNNFPVNEIIAQFSGGKVEWIEHHNCLPKQDLFLKPVSWYLSIGASVVVFNQELNQYHIQKPISPFPKRYFFDGYPALPLSSEKLIMELVRIGKKLPLLLQPRYHSHSSLIELCGEDESLVTARIVTAREFHGSSNFLIAFLRMSTQPGGAALPALEGIAAAIDPNSGQITCAHSKGEEIIRHPFTKMKFEGFLVPFAKDAIHDCLKVHDALATEGCNVPIVGFDIAFSDIGHFFMEANFPPDLNFQKLKSPLLYDKHYNRCIQSHLKPLQDFPMIHPDPIIRKKASNISILR